MIKLVGVLGVGECIGHICMCHVQIFRNDSTNFTRTHCLAYLVQNFPSYSRSITLPALGRMQRGIGIAYLMAELEEAEATHNSAV